MYLASRNYAFEFIMYIVKGVTCDKIAGMC